MGLVDWMGLLPWLAASAMVAAAGAWRAREHALRHGLVDQPGERRSHVQPTPRGGGIGIAMAWLLACGLAGARGWWPWPLAGAAFAGGLLVAAAGYADDHRHLSAWWRLLVHVAAGALVALGLAVAGASPWLWLGALAGVPVMVNVWNFMDGIDGIATTHALVASLAIAALAAAGPGAAPAVAPALLLAAACLGFLPFNFPRARIFMGDVGSGLLGFALAVLVLLLLAPAEPARMPGLLVLAVLPLSAFLVDATLTLGRRIVMREQWWTPHVAHAYQRLAARTGSHVPVTLGYSGWAIAASFLALVASGGAFTVKLAVCAGVLAAASLAWHASTRPPAREQKDLSHR